MFAKTHQSDDEYSHFYPRVWLLVMSIAVFGLYIAYDQGLLARIVNVDRSYLSIVVALMLIVMTIHAVWHVIRFSNRIRLAEQLVREGPSSNSWREAINVVDHNSDEFIENDMANTPAHYFSGFLNEIHQSALTNQLSNEPEPVSVLEIYADKLRSPVELGWYVVDLAIRMGLIGTIIGFILIFSSLTGNTIPGVDEMQALLISMSSGMGTALYTTLAGLVCATILGMQYLILGRETEHLIALMIRLRNRSIVGADGN